MRTQKAIWLSDNLTRFRILIIAAVTIAGGLWLLITGPMPVVRVSTPLHEKVSYWYMIAAFPFLGMLCADLISLYIIYGRGVRFVELGIQIILLILLSSLRLIVKIPISGHSILLGYIILRRLFVKFPTPKERIVELVFSAIALGAIVYYKLILWNDPISLTLGLVLSGVLISISFIILRSARDVG